MTDTDGRRIGLTIRLDEETARRIGSLATARGTTIDALAAAALASLLSEDARYEESEVGADQLLARSAARGDPAWRRDDVHDRADRG